MLQRFKDFLTERHLLAHGEGVLLAVSGGRDSVCMAHLFHRASIPFVVAHCNFHLRAGECDRDQQFVEQLALRLGVPCHTVSFDTRAHAAAHGESIEEAARHLRYGWFSSLAHSLGLAAVATAHHRDDSVETFLLNLLRGTGINGLHGIRPSSPLPVPGSPLRLIRPMLCFSRAEIDRYLAENHLQYVDDSTNDALDARRNQLRHRLVPLLRQLYPSFDTTMQANIQRIDEASLIYQSYIDQLRGRLVTPCRSLLPNLPFQMQGIHLQELAAFRFPLPTFLFELLRPYGFNADAVKGMLASAASGRQFFSATHVAELHRGHLLIAPLPATPAGQPPTPSYTLQESHPPGAPGDGVSAVTLDAGHIRLPLAVRPWRHGDRFHPFGMKGQRLVSDFLKDLKLSRIEKQQVRLLVDADDTILWVVGLRPDDRFRITPATRIWLTAHL